MRAPDQRAVPPALGQLTGDLSLSKALGGPRGMVEATLPGVAFVTVFTITKDLGVSLAWSLGAAAVLLISRLIRRGPVLQAIGGALGVGVCAFFAARSGRPEEFYLPSLWKNGLFAAGYAASALMRWPLLGVLLGPVLGEWFTWRANPARLRAYRQVTWIWVALFLVRLFVQLPLYLAGSVTALGSVNLALGWPLFALTLWLTYLVLRRVPVVPGHPPALLSPPRS